MPSQPVSCYFAFPSPGGICTREGLSKSQTHFQHHLEQAVNSSSAPCNKGEPNSRSKVHTCSVTENVAVRPQHVYSNEACLVLQLAVD
jgi:hypothetical protein